MSSSALPPWTTTTVQVPPDDAQRLVIGTPQAPEIIVHTQVLSPGQSAVTITNPHAYEVHINPGAPLAVAISLPWVDKDWTERRYSPLVAWTRAVTPARPTLKVEVEGHSIEGLVDTGADVSVIRDRDWSKEWELGVESAVRGVGGGAAGKRSRRLLKWDCEGTSGFFKPLCLAEIPISLWGRDILSAMGTVITTHPSTLNA